mmetsp:Transcript_1538/g.6707  ORF Transcript_1538/g.6707 Transcript_1538/m.6707 type:complete len:426 (-) Transcript_1538:255-1532(-)
MLGETGVVLPRVLRHERLELPCATMLRLLLRSLLGHHGKLFVVLLALKLLGQRLLSSAHEVANSHEVHVILQAPLELTRRRRSSSNLVGRGKGSFPFQAKLSPHTHVAHPQNAPVALCSDMLPSDRLVGQEGIQHPNAIAQLANGRRSLGLAHPMAFHGTDREAAVRNVANDGDAFHSALPRRLPSKLPGKTVLEMGRRALASAFLKPRWRLDGFAGLHLLPVHASGVLRQNLEVCVAVFVVLPVAFGSSGRLLGFPAAATLSLGVTVSTAGLDHLLHLDHSRLSRASGRAASGRSARPGLCGAGTLPLLLLLGRLACRRIRCSLPSFSFWSSPRPLRRGFGKLGLLFGRLLRLHCGLIVWFTLLSDRHQTRNGLAATSFCCFALLSLALLSLAVLSLPLRLRGVASVSYILGRCFHFCNCCDFR